MRERVTRPVYYIPEAQTREIVTFAKNAKTLVETGVCYIDLC